MFFFSGSGFVLLFFILVCLKQFTAITIAKTVSDNHKDVRYNVQLCILM
jgi:hypothetical protein